MTSALSAANRSRTGWSCSISRWISLRTEATDEVDGQSLLDEIVREGARRMLVAALDAEVAAYVDAHRAARDADGHALVVRNGKGRPRKVTVGAGTIPVSAHDSHGASIFTRDAAVGDAVLVRSAALAEGTEVAVLRSARGAVCVDGAEVQTHVAIRAIEMRLARLSALAEDALLTRRAPRHAHAGVTPLALGYVAVVVAPAAHTRSIVSAHLIRLAAEPAIQYETRAELRFRTARAARSRSVVALGAGLRAVGTLPGAAGSAHAVSTLLAVAGEAIRVTRARGDTLGVTCCIRERGGYVPAGGSIVHADRAGGTGAARPVDVALAPIAVTPGAEHARERHAREGRAVGQDPAESHRGQDAGRQALQLQHRDDFPHRKLDGQVHHAVGNRLEVFPGGARLGIRRSADVLQGDACRSHGPPVIDASEPDAVHVDVSHIETRGARHEHREHAAAPAIERDRGARTGQQRHDHLLNGAHALPLHAHEMCGALDRHALDTAPVLARISGAAAILVRTGPAIGQGRHQVAIALAPLGIA
jgi:hypothetical protein